MLSLTENSFIPHINQLKAKCQKALDLLRVVAHTDWEADRKVLLNLYRTIKKTNMIPSFGIRISSEFENMNLDLDNIAEFKVPDVPPWTFSQPRVLFSLHNDKKSQTDPLVFRTKYHELLSNFPSYETIFTDGSKDGDTAGSACVTPSDTYKCRLPDNASIFSAEIKAVDLALGHIEQSRSSDFTIFSDSLFVLQSLHNRHIENPLLLDVLLKHNELAELNRIVFCWLPSHVGIKGNEKADIAAKSALTLNISDPKIPFTDFKPSINAFVHNNWQMSWNAAVFNKLHSIMPSLGASYNLDYSRARAYCACSRCGWGWFGHFYSHLSFLLFLPLFGRRPDID